MQTLVKHKQTQVSHKGVFGLPMLQVSPYYSIGRGAIVQTKMALNAFVFGLAPNSTKISANILLEDSTGTYTLSTTVPLATGNTDSLTDILALINPAINAFVMANLGVLPDSISWLMSPITGTRSFSNPSLAVNTSRQASATQDALVNASVDITSALSLSGGASGKVSLQYADNTGFSTNVVTVQSFTNSNTGTLTIGINTSQVETASLTGIVPAGKFYRLVTTNVTGTPTYGTPVIQEVLL